MPILITVFTGDSTRPGNSFIIFSRIFMREFIELQVSGRVGL